MRGAALGPSAGYLLRLGSLIKFIPYTITTGFTSGIAITILVGQLKDFLGLTVVTEEPLIETMEKLKAVIEFIGTINWQAVIVGVVCLAILIIWPYFPGFCKKIPPSLIAVQITYCLAKKSRAFLYRIR